MSTRGRRLVLVAAVAALAASALAACAEQVDGSGQGSPVPTPSSFTPFSSSSSSTAPTSLTPIPTPTSSSIAPPPAALARTPVDTELGDPPLTDFCTSLGDDYLKSFGLEVEVTNTTFLAGCTWRLRKGDNTQFYASIYGSGSSKIPSGARSTMNGVQVVRGKADRKAGVCQRYALLRDKDPGIYTVVGSTLAGKKNSDTPCQIANRTMRRLTKVISTGRLRDYQLPEQTVTKLDACKVARAAGIAGLNLFRGATFTSYSFGAECLIANDSVSTYLDWAVKATLGTDTSHASVGSHQILAHDVNDKSLCEYSALNRPLSASGGIETVEIQSTALAAKGASDLCSATKTLFGRVLDTAGLP